MTYNYTKPRAPVYAMYTSPGPYLALPGLTGQIHHDPRSVHRKWPAYLIGCACPIKFRTIGPGPKYNLYNMYKNGKYNPPAYSMGCHLEDICKFVTPAPGTYRPEECMDVCSWYPTAPQYGFGLRHAQVRMDNVPGPNVYRMDSMICETVRSDKPQAPIYSLTPKNDLFNFCYDFAHSPGPCAHSLVPLIVYKKKSPLYSMTGKNYPPDNRTKIPGPGAHENEKVWVHKPYPPQASFGIRHSPFTCPLLVPADADD